jgi:hypothetical protein
LENAARFPHSLAKRPDKLRCYAQYGVVGLIR